MVAMELVLDRASKAPDAARVGRVMAAALKAGVVLLSAGTFGNVIRVLVPLTVSDAVVDEGLDVMAEALRASRLAPH
jgi:4-aminobutyrate aminotransferase/(S)-3-amino-2-methylpropionate transaminase